MSKSKAPVWTPCTVTLGELKPWAQNPRLSTRAQAARLLASFAKFGQVESVAIGPDNEVYDGHQRLSALLTIHGPDYTIDARRSDRALTDDERRALVVALHVGAVGQWDWQALAGWDGAQLQEWGMDGEALKTWNNDANNLKEMLAANEPEITDAEPQIDRAAELREKWQTERGQLWRIGEHRLLCGDSTVREDVERVMGGEKAMCLLTDPPYNVDYKGNYIQSGNILDEGEKIWSDKSFTDKIENFPEWLNGVYKISDGVMGNGCAIYIWHPAGAEGLAFWDSWLWDEWHFQVDLVWNKQSLIIARWDYKPQHEPCMYGWKGTSRKWTGANNESTVWDYPRQQGTAGGKREHPTEKPLPVFQRCISNHDAQIVVDPFSGSGTTLVACQNLSRRGRGIEISPEYCAVILERMAQSFPGIEISRIES